MLLFQKAFHDGLLQGSIRVTFRRWDKPRVRAGARVRCHPLGVLVIERIERVRVADIPEDDARAAGFADRASLLAYLTERAPIDDATEVYRVALHHGGDGDRVEGALDDTLADLPALRRALARLDANGAWTRKTLKLIAAHPRVAASQLAARLGRETAPFKADVVKLKKLGLTQSFEVGYEVSPRGRAYLDATTRRGGRTAAR